MRRMATSSKRAPTSAALRLARKSWRLQYRDSQRSLCLADQALEKAVASTDLAAEGWARLARGFYRMRYATPNEAKQELTNAQRCFETTHDRPGQILATVGIARCVWLAGKYYDSLDMVLPLRGEGLQILKQEERGMLLNVIAGCYSALGQSAEAFAYMYQALRETSPARNHGFDVVLYCNLAHELYLLGDYAEALSYVEEGIERCARLANANALSVLLINRVVCLTDLNRPQEAIVDVRRLLDLPADASGRGSTEAAFEKLAIAALRAGDLSLGTELVERAVDALSRAATPEERIELAVAEAELLRAHGRLSEAAMRLEQALPLPAEGLSLRVRCMFFQLLGDVHERGGNTALALEHMRTWQQLHLERAQNASEARYQAASLRSELLRLQHERDEIDARRRNTERAKAELEAMNQKLSQKVSEVESLQAALKEQAVCDFLTGLFNRRYLNDVLPSMLALAQRDREPLAVAIIDLDHFKAVNDRHGHLAGDMLLAAFGDLLAKRIRKSDVACRYGGEEFCLLLPRTDAHAARRKLDTLLRAWRNAVFNIETGTLSGNTFSAGVADSRSVSGPVEMLLKAADDCVLEAKRRGRDRVITLEQA